MIPPPAVLRPGGVASKSDLEKTRKQGEQQIVSNVFVKKQKKEIMISLEEPTLMHAIKAFLQRHTVELFLFFCVLERSTG